jgi:hypothetical protein
MDLQHYTRSIGINCSALASWMSRPGNWKNNQEISVYHHSSTYPRCGVALEGTGVDLDISAIRSKDCSALLSWMSRPGNWSTKKVQERSADQHSFTYVFSGVALEGASVDLHIGTAYRINCSALLSWMSRPRT